MTHTGGWYLLQTRPGKRGTPRGMAEWFDSVTQGLVVDTNRGFFSPGTRSLLTERLECGLRVGWGITADAAPLFSDAGFGRRW